MTQNFRHPVGNFDSATNLLSACEVINLGCQSHSTSTIEHKYSIEVDPEDSFRHRRDASSLALFAVAPSPVKRPSVVIATQLLLNSFTISHERVATFRRLQAVRAFSAAISGFNSLNENSTIAPLRAIAPSAQQGFMEDTASIRYRPSRATTAFGPPGLITKGSLYPIGLRR